MQPHRVKNSDCSRIQGWQTPEGDSKLVLMHKERVFVVVRASDTVRGVTESLGMCGHEKTQLVTGKVREARIDQTLFKRIFEPSHEWIIAEDAVQLAQQRCAICLRAGWCQRHCSCSSNCPQLHLFALFCGHPQHSKALKVFHALLWVLHGIDCDGNRDLLA